ncbi:DUF4224 domain-containing protein [Klebsiella variicola]|nr:DUF4224 domain-containing protein [Klebsiella variicola]MDF8299800.1 DUF4224 domain-containing protein [Klebsiella variicola]
MGRNDLLIRTFPKQCEALRRAGIFFMERADGHPKTTWGHFLNPIKYRNQQENTVREEEPDFGAIFNGRKA